MKLLTLLITVLITSWRDLVFFLFPKTCIHCHAILYDPSNFLCISCLSKIGDFPYVDGQRILLDSFGKLFQIKSLFFLFPFVKGGSSQSLIHYLKYRGQKQIGIDLGRQLGFKIQEFSADMPELIVPIPLHKHREKERGYNQALYIAKGIHEYCGIPIDSSLIRKHRETASQTKKNRQERWLNLAGGFEIDPTKISRYQGRHILIVDDVFTTGATVEAALSALASSLHCHISISVLAYSGEVWE